MSETIEQAIQPHGFLLVLSPDWIIQHASLNVDKFLGESHVTLIGEPLGRFVMAEPLHDLRNRLGGTQRVFGTRLTDEPRRFDLAIRRLDDRIIFEGVAGSASYGESFGAVGALIAGLHRERLLEDGARRMRALTGYDRVMLCLGERFVDSVRTGVQLPDCSPANCARLSVIADAEAPPVGIFPASDEPIDALLLSPSAEARRQLNGGGCAASMQVPLLIAGECAGTFHCQHRSARLPSLEQQAAAELFAQMFGMLAGNGCSESA